MEEEKKDNFFSRTYNNVKNKIVKEIDESKLNNALESEFNKNCVVLTYDSKLLFEGIKATKKVLAKLDIDHEKLTVYGKKDFKKDDILKDANGTVYAVRVVNIVEDYVLLLDCKEHKVVVTEMQYKVL